MESPARVEWWGDDVAPLRAFDLDSQRSGEAIERITVLPVRTEPAVGPLERRSLLDLLPSDSVIVLEQESALEQEVDRAWAEATHHLDVARRLGEEAPPRDALFVEPAAWRDRLARFPRLALNAPDGDLRLPLAPPEAVDRDIRRLRQIVAGEPATVILCDNEGQLERLEELLDTERATLVVGARRVAGWRRSCSISTRGASSRPAMPSRPTRRGSASSSPRFSTRTRPTSGAPPRK